MKLTFGDDGSEACDRVWSWITSHPWPGWDIEVVHAESDPATFRWGEPPVLQPWEPVGDRPTARLQADRVDFTHAHADPRALLGELDTDLLAVAIKSRRPLHSALIGSTAEWLLHHPPAPLALVRRVGPVSQVLVCADGSPHAERAANALRSLPWIDTCTITVATVDDGRADPDAARKMAETFPTAVSVSHRVLRGGVSDSLITAASDLEVDLVVMGTRGLTGWKRLRLGSTASAVVRAAACDHLLACVDDETA